MPPLDRIAYKRIAAPLGLALLCAFVITAEVGQEPTGAADWNSRLEVWRLAASFPQPSNTGPAPSSRWVKVTIRDFDPQTLAQSLRNTKAIGFFTKLQLKGDIEGLVKELADLHQGKGQTTLAQLHERFQLLVHKIVSLLQEKDPELAKSITNARQSMWDWVSDPNKSVKL